jgi:putative RecB family exonuclease
LYGANVHGVISKFLERVRDGLDTDWRRMEDIFNDRWREASPLGAVENEELRQQALELVRGFWDACSPDFGSPLLLEERFSIAMDGIKLEGIVDRVEGLPSAGVEVIDYKSGSAPDRNLAERNPQLLIYAMACTEAWSLRPERVSLYYLAGNTVQSWPIKESDIDEAREKVEATGRQIRGAEFDPRTGTHCRECDYLRACNFGRAWVESNG